MKPIEYLEQQIIHENLKEVLQKTFLPSQTYPDFQKDMKEYVLRFLTPTSSEIEFFELGKDVISYQLEQQGTKFIETYEIAKQKQGASVTVTISSTKEALKSIHITIPILYSSYAPLYSSLTKNYYNAPIDWLETDIIFFNQVVKVKHQKQCLSLTGEEQTESYYLDGRKILSRKTQELMGERKIIEERFVSEGICFLKTRNTSTMKKNSDKPYSYFEIYRDNYMDLEFTSTSTITRNQFDKRMKGSYSRIRELKK